MNNIPYNKLSKKKQRELNLKKRTQWGFSPRTRVIEDKREREKYEKRYWAD